MGLLSEAALGRARGTGDTSTALLEVANKRSIWDTNTLQTVLHKSEIKTHPATLLQWYERLSFTNTQLRAPAQPAKA